MGSAVTAQNDFVLDGTAGLWRRWVLGGRFEVWQSLDPYYGAEIRRIYTTRRSRRTTRVGPGADVDWTTDDRGIRWMRCGH